MFYDKTLRIFLLVSLMLHGVLFATMPKFNLGDLNKSLHQLEITYQKFQISSKIVPEKEIVRKQAIEDNKELSIASKKNLIKRFFKKNDFLSKTFKVSKKPAAANTDAKEKKVVIPELDSQIKSPAYKSYYQTIRERIRNAYVNYLRYGEGEVYLSFVLSSDGSLKDIKIFDDRSTNDAYLRDTALKSINDSAPFPSFPKSLGYPELSFNVIISFEVDN